MGRIDRELMLPDRRHAAYHVICLALLPIVLLAVDPNVFVNPAGNEYLDPWVYTGFVLNFPDLLHRFGDTYYATRLPWLLPGFAFHTMLPPLAANYAFHLTFFYALLLSTYALVASGANRSVAFVATVLMALNPQVLTSFSWDYVDGAGIVFLVTAFCGFDRAVRAGAGAGWWRWSLLAGAAMACLVATNLAMVTALPACAVFLFVRSESPRWRSTLSVLAASVVGAVAVLVMLGALNRVLGGSWLFLEPSLSFARRVGTPGANIWKAPAFDWSRAEWIVLPACAAAGAILFLALRRRVASRFEQAPQVALLAFVGTWLLLAVLADATFFRYTWYTSYVIALAIVALALQAAWPAAAGTRRAVGFELAVLAVLVGAHVLFSTPAGLFRVAAWAPAALLVAVIGLQVIRFRSARWALFVLGLALSYAASNQYWKPRVAGGRADFAATAAAHRFIATSVGNGPLRIWHPALRPGSPPLRSVACTYLCSRLLVNEDLPRLTPAEAASIAPSGRLVMLVNTSSEEQAASATLRRFGLDYSVVAHEQFGSARGSFVVFVGDVSPAERHAEAAPGVTQ